MTRFPDLYSQEEIDAMSRKPPIVGLLLIWMVICYAILAGVVWLYL